MPKRTRSEDADVSNVAQTFTRNPCCSSTSHYAAVEAFDSTEQLDRMLHLLQQPKSTRLPPLSYVLAPAVPLPVWQRVCVSALSHVEYHRNETQRARVKRNRLATELTKYHADVKAREEKLRREQREARARLGIKLSTAASRFWARRVDGFQSIARVEFDVMKHYHDKRKQEDLLNETEMITKRLLDSILAKTKATNAAVSSASSSNAGDKLCKLEEFRQSGGDGSVNIESTLSLLDTQEGNRPLRHYQRSALHWMVHLYENNLNGILADEMGLGKTVQTIALICYFAEYRNDWGPHLVVVPTTVVLNWKAELQRWAPGLKVVTYVGNAKERHRLRAGWTREDAFHVCVTSYTLVVQDRNVFRRRPWGFLVLDEAHQVKNFMSKKWQSLFDLQAEYRLLLTGTPLQNSIMELWSLFHFLLPSASAFRSNDEFKEWFSNPMDDMITGRTSLNEDVVRRLQTLIRPFMLRRLKKDVESQLPSKAEQVVQCRLSCRQRAMYDDYMQLADTRRRLRAGGTGGVMTVLLALRKVCDHPDLFEERPTISPLVLDYLGDIVFPVPRLILLRDNYYGTRRSTFTRYRFAVRDLNEDCPTPLLSDCFDWLPCTLTKIVFTTIASLPFGNGADTETLAARFSPYLLQWSRTKSLGKIDFQKTGLSDPLIHVLQSSLQTLERNCDAAMARTHCFQGDRHHRMAASVNLYWPSLCTDHVLKDAIIKQSTPAVVAHTPLPLFCPTLAQRVQAALPIVQRVAVYVPSVLSARPPRLHCALPVAHMRPFCAPDRTRLAPFIGAVARAQDIQADGRMPRRDTFDGSFCARELWPMHVRRCFSFPDKRLLIHDCGKLQFLAATLPRLRQEGHRMLIFTQFVQMLNILEQFLALVGIAYMRLDGSTHVEQRQLLVDHFNEDTRVTCMILSTRSGGIGLNLTGADTVIFYDSDWNPTMDLQAQDRCHRIGQTRPVTIYRLISEHTVEESILQKARERKKLNNVVIRGGQFSSIAEVADEYDDSAAAFAALSNPVNLRSFFHDLDEDASVVEVEEGKSENTTKLSREELLAEMQNAEDAEDRKAQQQLEQELRQRADEENADQLLLNDEDGGSPFSAVGIGSFQEGDLPLASSYFAGGEDDGLVDAKLRPLIHKRQREVLANMKTPLDRLLSVRYGACHEDYAHARYEMLCDTYAERMDEDEELPPFRPRVPLL